MKPQAELNLIREILKKVDTPTTSSKILSGAIDGIKDSFGCLAVAIIVVDGRNEYFRVINSRGWGNEFIKAFHIRPFQGLVKEMVTQKTPLLIRQGDPRCRSEGYDFQHCYEALLAVPMSIRGKRIGFLYLSSDNGNSFNDDQQNVLKDFANLCTLVLDHGSLGDQVLSMSNIDSLTGLYSYKFWHEELHRDITRAEKLGLDVALMEISLNKFKDYNSMYGHVKGDELLVDVSEIIRGELDALDVPCRVSSGWHVVLVGKDKTTSHRIAEGILAAIEEKAPVDNFSISLSIGLSMYQKGEGEKDLINRVEDCLREARRQGGNALHVR